MDRQAIATMKGKTVEDLIAEFARSNKDKDLAWTTGNHGNHGEWALEIPGVIWL